MLCFLQFALYSTAESAALYTDYGDNEVEMDGDGWRGGDNEVVGHKCEKLDVCAVVPYGRTLQMTIMDNWFVPAVPCIMTTS